MKNFERTGGQTAHSLTYIYQNPRSYKPRRCYGGRSCLLRTRQLISMLAITAYSIKYPILTGMTDSFFVDRYGQLILFHFALRPNSHLFNDDSYSHCLSRYRFVTGASSADERTNTENSDLMRYATPRTPLLFVSIADSTASSLITDGSLVLDCC